MNRVHSDAFRKREENGSNDNDRGDGVDKHANEQKRESDKETGGNRVVTPDGKRGYQRLGNAKIGQ